VVATTSNEAWPKAAVRSWALTFRSSTSRQSSRAWASARSRPATSTPTSFSRSRRGTNGRQRLRGWGPAQPTSRTRRCPTRDASAARSSDKRSFAEFPGSASAASPLARNSSTTDFAGTPSSLVPATRGICGWSPTGPFWGTSTQSGGNVARVRFPPPPLRRQIGRCAAMLICRRSAFDSGRSGRRRRSRHRWRRAACRAKGPAARGTRRDVAPTRRQEIRELPPSAVLAAVAPQRPRRARRSASSRRRSNFVGRAPRSAPSGRASRRSSRCCSRAATDSGVSS
jgi:hypothetical protein